MRWFGLSIAPFSKHNERFARASTVKFPDFALLRLRSPPFKSSHLRLTQKTLSRSRNIHRHGHTYTREEDEGEREREREREGERRRKARTRRER